MKRCPECKALNSDAASHCEKCGADISLIQNTTKTNNQLEEVKYEPRHIFYYIVLVIFVFEFLLILLSSLSFLLALLYIALAVIQFVIEVIIFKAFKKFSIKSAESQSDFWNDISDKMNKK